MAEFPKSCGVGFNDLTNCLEDEARLIGDRVDECPVDDSLTLKQSNPCEADPCAYICGIVDEFRFSGKPRATGIAKAIATVFHSNLLQLCASIDCCVIGRVMGFDCIQCEGMATAKRFCDSEVCPTVSPCIDSSILCESEASVKQHQYDCDSELYKRMLYVHIHHRFDAPTPVNIKRIASIIYDSPVSIGQDCKIRVHKKTTQEERHSLLVISSLIPMPIGVRAYNYLTADQMG